MLWVASAAMSATVDNTKDGFTVTLPTGWDQIPQSEIASLNETTRKEHNIGNQPGFLCGYQVRSDGWFSYPYVLIRVARSGKLTEEQLAKLPTINVTESVDKVMQAWGGTFPKFQMGKIFYDSASHITWLAGQTTDPEIGLVDILIGALQTEQGAIQTYCYSRHDSVAQDRPTFTRIIESIRPSEEVRYKPASTTLAVSSAANAARQPDYTWLGRAIGLALVGALSLTLKRRSKQESVGDTKTRAPECPPSTQSRDPLKIVARALDDATQPARRR